MKKILFCLFIITFQYSCFSGSCAVEKPATIFANLLRDGKHEEAKEKCTDKGAAFLDSCIRHSVSLKVIEVRDVRCKVKEKFAICEFCCAEDSLKRTFTMIKTKEGGGYCNVCGTWSADDLSGLRK